MIEATPLPVPSLAVMATETFWFVTTAPGVAAAAHRRCLVVVVGDVVERLVGADRDVAVGVERLHEVQHRLTGRGRCGGTAATRRQRPWRARWSATCRVLVVGREHDDPGDAGVVGRLHLEGGALAGALVASVRLIVGGVTSVFDAGSKYTVPATLLNRRCVPTPVGDVGFWRNCPTPRMSCWRGPTASLNDVRPWILSGNAASSTAGSGSLAVRSIVGRKFTGLTLAMSVEVSDVISAPRASALPVVGVTSTAYCGWIGRYWAVSWRPEFSSRLAGDSATLQNVPRVGGGRHEVGVRGVGVGTDVQVDRERRGLEPAWRAGRGDAGGPRRRRGRRGVDPVHRQAVHHDLLQHLLVIGRDERKVGRVALLGEVQRVADGQAPVEALGEVGHQLLGSGDDVGVAVAVARVADEQVADSGELLRPIGFECGVDAAAQAERDVGDRQAGVAAHAEQQPAGRPGR